MLASAATIELVATVLEERKVKNVVIDPVRMLSETSQALLRAGGLSHRPSNRS